jgi:SWIM zinc finger
MSEVIREFLVQGSESSPYKVVFKKTGSDLKATCSCRAGVNRLLCKHRLSILDGDKGAVDSENTDQVIEVASWLTGSNVGEAISEVVALEAEKKLIEEKIKRAKKLVAKALI